MAFDVSTLPAYVEQNNSPLLRKAIFGGKTISLLTPRLGIKSAETLNLIDDSVFFQEGEGCGFNASGATTFTQRTLTTGKIKVNKVWCIDDLEPKFTQYSLLKGAIEDSIPFEADLMQGQLDQINNKMELAVWKGDTASSNGDLNQFDGLIKIISGSTGYITGNTGSYTSITVSNVIAILNMVYAAIPDVIINKPDTVVFVGTDVYRLWVQALTTANLFNYKSDGTQASMEFIIPGTDVKVIAVLGLSGTGKIVAGALSNFFYGTDLMNDFEKFVVYYDPKNIEFDLTIKWRAGVQVAFPDQIVYFKTN